MPTLINRERIIRLVNAGYSFTQAGAILNVSKGVVAGVMKRERRWKSRAKDRDFQRPLAKGTVVDTRDLTARLMGDPIDRTRISR